VIERRARGPSLRKATKERLVVLGGVRVRTSDARLREMFAAADVVSEGGVRDEAGGPTWYGSTSLILPLPDDLGEADRELARAVVERDVHARLRAVRAAALEAKTRSPRPLGRISSEIRVELDGRGLRIDVDVQAPLIERRLGGARSGR
jgi:hypothetical protein